jgi:2'-5' RNA ligase
VLARLEALQARLASGVSSARWTPTEQIHLTVKFLGDVPESVLPDVCDAVSQIAERIASFDLEIRGAGVFPPHGQVNIVWAGFAAVPPALLDCQSVKMAEQLFSTTGVCQAKKDGLKGSLALIPFQMIKEPCENFIRRCFTLQEIIQRLQKDIA